MRSRRLAEEAGISLIHMALAFVIRHPAVTAAIIGPRTMEQLESQLGAADVATRRPRCSIASTRSSRPARRSTRPTPGGPTRLLPRRRAAGERAVRQLAATGETARELTQPQHGRARRQPGSTARGNSNQTRVPPSGSIPHLLARVSTMYSPYPPPAPLASRAVGANPRPPASATAMPTVVSVMAAVRTDRRLGCAARVQHGVAHDL